MTSIDELPHEMWNIIIDAISFIDFIAVRSTCKNIYKYMDIIYTDVLMKYVSEITGLNVKAFTIKQLQRTYKLGRSNKLCAMDIHRYAYISNGNIYMQNDSTYEQLHIQNDITPSQIVSGNISTFMYILDSDGKVYVYDYNDEKLLPIIEDDIIIQISYNGQFRLFLSADGTVYCHSWQPYGSSISFTPVTTIENLPNINKVTGTIFYALFLDDMGDVYFKGKFKAYQSDINATKLKTIKKIKDIYSSCYTSLLIDINNNIYLLSHDNNNTYVLLIDNMDNQFRHFIQLDEYKHISISDKYMITVKNNGDIIMFRFDNGKPIFIINPLQSNNANDILGIDVCLSHIVVYVDFYNEERLIGYDVGHFLKNNPNV